MTTTDPVVKVHQHLTAIVDMCTRLEDQAIAEAGDKLMPGGLAMVALASAAPPSEYDEQLEYAEHHALAGLRDWPVVEDDDTWEPPLQTLLFWSEAWRVEHGYPLPARPTVASEANFIRWAAEWAWDNEPRWDDFATDIRKTRARIEAVLMEGMRDQITRVVCDNPTCETPRRLVFVHGSTEAEDRWKCRSCSTWYDVDGFRRAMARQYRSSEAEKYIPLVDAIGVLRAQGRAERTIRKWLEPPLKHTADRCVECGAEWPPREYGTCRTPMVFKEQIAVCGGDLVPVRRGDPDAIITGYCDLRTRRAFAWWPDLWRRHLSTQTRARSGA